MPSLTDRYRSQLVQIVCTYHGYRLIDQNIIDDLLQDGLVQEDGVGYLPTPAGLAIEQAIDAERDARNATRPIWKEVKPVLQTEHPMVGLTVAAVDESEATGLRIYFQDGSLACLETDGESLHGSMSKLDQSSIWTR